MKRLTLLLLVASFSAGFLHAESVGRELRVLTYNIHHAEGTDGVFDYNRLAQMILSVEPDIVALQEVDRGTARAEGVDQAKRLAELTGMHFAFGNAMDYSGGEYGEALLSRFPLSDIKVHALSCQEGQEPRAAVDGLVQPTNGIPPFRFVGTHLCHQSQATRLQQVKELNTALTKDGSPPVILAGDFNARPGSPPIKELLSNGWLDTTEPQSIIDYIFVRPEDPWKIKKIVTVDDRVTSDHRPVLAVLQYSAPH